MARKRWNCGQIRQRGHDRGWESRRDLLRAATEGLHRRLDTRFTPADFRDRSTSVRFLECTARALLPLERALNHSVVPERFTDWRLRRRSDALSQDLRALDAAYLGDDDVRHFELQPAEAFGVLYVLEGSRLGSKVLLRHTQSSEDLALRSATRYLPRTMQLCGARSWRHWRTKKSCYTKVSSCRARALRSSATCRPISKSLAKARTHTSRGVGSCAASPCLPSSLGRSR